VSFIAGALICAPIFYTLGRIRERDARTHESLDVAPALARSKKQT